jgi:dTDP-4-dehydrorhamnose reductase
VDLSEHSSEDGSPQTLTKSALLATGTVGQMLWPEFSNYTRVSTDSTSLRENPDQPRPLSLHGRSTLRLPIQPFIGFIGTHSIEKAPMKILITGLRGTLAPHFSRLLGAQGHELHGWDRERVDPNEPAACWEWLEKLAPEQVFHLGFGSEDWAGLLASWCAQRGRGFAFTSTAMVFDSEPDGPHWPGDPTTARDDYGRYKIRCEQRIREAKPDALIVRIGWQIDLAAQGNNMAQQLLEQAREQGFIKASRLWTPAASLMADTAAVTCELLASGAAGVHHLDSNAEDRLSFVELAGRLGRALGQSWEIRENEDYKHDQRLMDSAVKMPRLSDRL